MLDNNNWNYLVSWVRYQTASCVRLQSLSLEIVGHLFINITIKSTLTWIGSSCKGFIY